MLTAIQWSSLSGKDKTTWGVTLCRSCPGVNGCVHRDSIGLRRNYRTRCAFCSRSVCGEALYDLRKRFWPSSLSRSRHDSAAAGGRNFIRADIVFQPHSNFIKGALTGAAVSGSSSAQTLMLILYRFAPSLISMALAHSAKGLSDCGGGFFERASFEIDVWTRVAAFIRCRSSSR